MNTKITDIRYDVPILINRQQFLRVMPVFNELVAWKRVKGENYEIKLWVMKYKNQLQQILNL